MNSNPDLPGVIASPPRLYVGLFLLSVIVQFVYPVALAGEVVGVRVVGVVLMVASGLFARWAFVTMERGGTSASLERASASLTTSGPFAWTRNPIYVAMTGLYLGLALLMKALWPLLFLVPLLALMQWGVIRREEAYLAGRFGAAYEAYRARVRRWL